MSVATSLIEESSARVTSAPAETLYQFNESPLLARQASRNPMRAVIRGAFPWR